MVFSIWSISLHRLKSGGGRVGTIRWLLEQYSAGARSPGDAFASRLASPPPTARAANTDRAVLLVPLRQMESGSGVAFGSSTRRALPSRAIRIPCLRCPCARRATSEPCAPGQRMDPHGCNLPIDALLSLTCFTFWVPVRGNRFIALGQSKVSTRAQLPMNSADWRQSAEPRKRCTRVIALQNGHEVVIVRDLGMPGTTRGRNAHAQG